MIPVLTTDVLAAPDIVSAVRLQSRRKGACACFRRKPQVATRTTQTVVRFNSAFALPGLDAPQPAGEYRVDLDEGFGAVWLPHALDRKYPGATREW